MTIASHNQRQSDAARDTERDDKLAPDARRLIEIVREFPRRRVLVVGDLIADQFIYGEISRVSREAPVLILRHERTATVPGGAANCALNLAALGAQVQLIGSLGKDAAGHAMLNKLIEAGVDCGGIVSLDEARTTTKVRVLAGGTHSTRQQVIRIDYEETMHADARQHILANLRARFHSVDACIASDYNYGVTSDEVIEELRRYKLETGKSVLVDSRYRLTAFTGFTAATPNEDEVKTWRDDHHDNTTTLESAAITLRRELGLQALLVTRGSQGMLLIEENGAPHSLAIIGSLDAVDVTGAGDTVMATYTLALASNSTHLEAARLANHAGGIVVMKRGTATATADELIASVRQQETRDDHI